MDGSLEALCSGFDEPEVADYAELLTGDGEVMLTNERFLRDQPFVSYIAAACKLDGAIYGTALAFDIEQRRVIGLERLFDRAMQVAKVRLLGPSKEKYRIFSFNHRFEIINERSKDGMPSWFAES